MYLVDLIAVLAFVVVLLQIVEAVVVVLVLLFVLLLDECSPRSNTTHSTYNHYFKNLNVSAVPGATKTKYWLHFFKFRSTFFGQWPHPRRIRCDILSMSP